MTKGTCQRCLHRQPVEARLQATFACALCGLVNHVVEVVHRRILPTAVVTAKL